MTELDRSARRVNSRTSPQYLDDLVNQPRWMTWQEKERQNQDGEIKKTKPPYNPQTGKPASATDPSTWGTFDQAKRRWDRMRGGGAIGGTGIALGDLRNGYWLGGFDLDGCVTWNGKKYRLDPLTDKIIEMMDTYHEFSPSDHGIKGLLLIRDGDIDAIRDLLERKSFGAGDHHEIAIYCERRYFTVTWDYLGREPRPLRVVSVDDIKSFIEEAEKFMRLHASEDANEQQTRRRDQSGSGYGYRFMATCKALGLNLSQTLAAIKQDTNKPGDWADRIDASELKRTYDNAPKRVFDDVKSMVQQHLAKITVAAFSAKALQGMKLPPLRYIVPGLLPAGVTLFAGKPKIGKSWLMLSTAVAKADGGLALGGLRCQPGDVLYCALEDNERRLQDRMHKLQIARWPERLSFCLHMPRLDAGGLEMIREWAKTAEHPSLVIIDTLARVRSRNGKNQSTQYAVDYGELSELQTLALELGIAIVVVHHQRKLDADDVFDTISGTLGLNGAADTLLTLYREKSGAVILAGRGRDLPDFEKAMQFDPRTCRWRIEGDADEVRLSAERAALTKAMREVRRAKLSEIAAEAGLHPKNASRLLLKMVRAGQARRYGHGEYGLDAEDDLGEGDD